MNLKKVGNSVTKLKEKYSLILPLLAFTILCLGFLLKKTVSFVVNYED